jgi:hypothetical protein
VAIGLVFLAAGFAVMTLPVLALAAFLRVGAIILIVLGAAGLLVLPRERNAVATAA